MPLTQTIFKHFLITRFNLVYTYEETDRAGRPVHTDEWMEHRLSLFEQFCLPSVLNQRCKDFEWLILVRQRMKQEHLQYLQRLVGVHSWIHLVEVADGQPFIPACTKTIHRLLEKGHQYAITTRLDNDDMIRDDFIEVVQSLFQPKENLLIDVVRGWQLGIGSPKACLAEAMNRYNPFITLVEQRGSVQTVFAHAHSEWQGRCTYTSYDLAPLWVEVVHERNKDNRLRGGKRLVGPVSWKRYGLIDRPFIMESGLEVFFHNLRRSVANLRLRLAGAGRRQR